jgi:antibiotic biosynthesis monooxygenase (ABM) superfamily enzyme
MSESAVLIATAKVCPGKEDAFATWKAHHDTMIAKFPGLISSDIMPPDEHSDAWTIVLNFQSQDSLTDWQQSKERGALIAELLPLLRGGDIGEVMQKETTQAGQPGTNVTQVILSKIRPGMEDAYRAWAAKIQQAQSLYPGYRGMYLQPPTSTDGHWTTLLRYDTAAHLEAWMAAPERAELLKESTAFIESEELMRLATSFPGWVPINPLTGKGPPDWKTALLVLLGLFPVVMLELRFLSPVLKSLGLHASLATFIGNALSVAATSFIAMPLFVRWFGWWLFPADTSTWRATSKGIAILVVLFALEVAALWQLLPW